MKRSKQASVAPARGASKGGGLAAAAAAMKEAARDEDLHVPRRKSKAAKKPKTRAGKKGLVLYVLPEVTVALRKLALENGSDVQSMGWRALELLFAEYKTALPGAQKVSAKS